MTGCPARRRAAMRHAHAVVGLASAATSLILIAGSASPLGAQADTAGPALQFSVGAGPALAVRAGTDARLGYTVQGAVTLVRTPSPVRLRTDVAYLHVETPHGNMHGGPDRTLGRDAEAVSSTAGFVSAVLTSRAARGIVPYAIGGIGIGWVSAMRGVASVEQNGGAAGLAWLAGGGVEGGIGRRAIRLEARLQSIREAGGTGWYTTVPVTIGVRF